MPATYGCCHPCLIIITIIQAEKQNSYYRHNYTFRHGYRDVLLVALNLFFL